MLSTGEHFFTKIHARTRQIRIYAKIELRPVWRWVENRERLFYFWGIVGPKSLRAIFRPLGSWKSRLPLASVNFCRAVLRGFELWPGRDGDSRSRSHTKSRCSRETWRKRAVTTRSDRLKMNLPASATQDNWLEISSGCFYSDRSLYVFSPREVITVAGGRNYSPG